MLVLSHKNYALAYLISSSTWKDMTRLLHLWFYIHHWRSRLNRTNLVTLQHIKVELCLGILIKTVLWCQTCHYLPVSNEVFWIWANFHFWSFNQNSWTWSADLFLLVGIFRKFRNDGSCECPMALLNQDEGKATEAFEFIYIKYLWLSQSLAISLLFQQRAFLCGRIRPYWHSIPQISLLSTKGVEDWWLSFGLRRSHRIRQVIALQTWKNPNENWTSPSKDRALRKIIP